MKRGFFKIFLIVFVNVLVWFSLFSAPFLWDDDGIIVNNIFVNSLVSVKFLFSKFYFDIFGELSYRPVVTLSHIIDSVVFGKYPAAHHFIGLVIHIINSLLLFLILNKLSFIDNTVKFFTVLLFSIHPVHLETLFVVAYRDELLMTMFLLIGYLSYFYFHDSRKKRFVLLSVLAFILSVFSKETAIVFLPMILFTDVLVFKRKILKNVFFYFCMLSVLVFYCLIRFVYMKNPEESLRNVEFASQFFILFRPTIIFPLAARVCLFPLTFILDYHNKTSLMFLSVQGAVLIVGTVVCFIFSKFKKGFLFALIIIVSGIFPVMNIYPLENFFANRYMYLPAIGFSLLLGLLVSSVFSIKRNIKHAVLLLIFVLMIIANFKGTPFFRSDSAFANKLLNDSPLNYKALNYLGTEEVQDGNLDLAYDYFTKSLEINSTYYEAVYNLSLVYSDKNQNEKAFKTASYLLELNPGNSHGYRLLGDILYSTGLLDEAEDYYSEALTVNKYDIQAGNNLGIIYESQNRLNEAADLYISLLSMYSKFDLAWSNLGNVNIKRRDYGFAERCFLNALRIKPDNPKTWYNLGNAYYYQDKHDNAEKCYLESVKLDKSFADPLYNLAALYLTKNKKIKAVTFLEKYLVLKPSDQNAIQTLNNLKKGMYRKNNN